MGAISNMSLYAPPDPIPPALAVVAAPWKAETDMAGFG